MCSWLYCLVALKQNFMSWCAQLFLVRPIILMVDEPSISENFLNLATSDCVAKLFDMEYKQLADIIYNTPPARLYNNFTIPKKSGGYRFIKSPCLILKKIQKILSEVLLEVHNPKPSAHGFNREKSILTNAQPHVGKRHVFNIDLEGFFDSINFGRVRGMFMGRPYNLPKAPATVLAQICCFKGILPQGAPTSPIISNMICAKLDSYLLKLAKRYCCTYTRYADDITFSFSCKYEGLPSHIVTFEKGEAVPGIELTKVIEENGFKINYNKVRICTGSQRKEVTGLTVNERPNVKRRYVKQIRSMIYAWEKFGYEQASEESLAKYYSKHRASGENPEFKNVVRGKLLFLQMIKGPRDHVYVNLAKRFNALLPDEEKRLRYLEDKNKEQAVLDSLWVLESLYDAADGSAVCSQGTGFVLDGFGVVTCAHVVSSNGKVLEKIKAFQCQSLGSQYDVRVKLLDLDRDIAILELLSKEKVPIILKKSIGVAESDAVSQKEPIALAGFPAYKIGQSPYWVDGKVASTYAQSGVEKFEIDIVIREGNSGGPVLNSNFEVVGIAAEGAEKSGGNNAVIKIGELFKAQK